MDDTTSEVDRSTDISQPLERLGPDERLKHDSRFLRGTISDSLPDRLTGAVTADDTKLLKFQGIYQQDDRDVRERRRDKRLEPDYRFMARVRLPGGVLTPAQWLELDHLARERANGTLRLTTRQTFQYHGIKKEDLKPLIQGLGSVGLDTISACGDDLRGIMSAVNPHLSALHREVYELARDTGDDILWRSGAYREIWFDEKRPVDDNEEPFYGPTYMPRKFKIGFAIPPVNDIDVLAQDLGYIAIVDGGELVGFNVAIGGGMGNDDSRDDTYPRIADVIGYVDKAAVIELSKTVMSVQRDYGNRIDRGQARFKYTIDRLGIEWVKGEIERRAGYALEAARDYRFTTRGDPYGWQTGDDGRHHLTLFIENGRLANHEGHRLLDGLAAVAGEHRGEFRVTPNQNVIIANVDSTDVERIDQLLNNHGIAPQSQASALRLQSMACVALPTCGLAMAESERYLPSLLDRIEELTRRHGIENEPITLRMTGCPNGCARPYVAEIGFTGRAPGKYNVYLGADATGERIGQLYRENIGEEPILELLDDLFGRFANNRATGETFGDWCHRTLFAATE